MWTREAVDVHVREQVIQKWLGQSGAELIFSTRFAPGYCKWRLKRYYIPVIVSVNEGWDPPLHSQIWAVMLVAKAFCMKAEQMLEVATQLLSLVKRSRAYPSIELLSS